MTLIVTNSFIDKRVIVCTYFYKLFNILKFLFNTVILSVMLSCGDNFE